jgi:Xaa-Pro dipeptidase
MLPARHMAMPADLLVTEQEYEDRLAAVRTVMPGRELDLCRLATPENIYYLTGLDHWGYFAAHMLIVPEDGEVVLITRAMEQITVANQVRNARFEGHEDNETAADVTVRWLRQQARRRPRIGIEKWSSGLPCGLAEKVCASLPEAIWLDVSGLVDQLRQ